MIEVEKKFQPSEEQLSKIASDSVFVQDKLIEDVYYDYPDYSLFKKDIWLRKRNGLFELKIEKSSGAREEIENGEEIKKYFKTDNLKEFIDNNLIIIMEWQTKRREYKNNNIIIDIDELSFGYKLCEIEIMVRSEEDVPEAEEKIRNFASKYQLENNNPPAKRSEYFRIVKPELYKRLFN